MTIRVSICNTDQHRKIVVYQCGMSEGRPTGTRTPVVISPLTTAEFYVHQYQRLEIDEAPL